MLGMYAIFAGMCLHWGSARRVKQAYIPYMECLGFICRSREFTRHQDHQVNIYLPEGYLLTRYFME